MGWTVRIATPTDMPELSALMDMSIAELQHDFLNETEVEASYEIMGIDTQLVEDGTYFAVEEAGTIIGCGGWSRRATLFGGDHTQGRDARLLNPATEPARVRAMYTHPAHTRRGIGRAVLDACEAAARKEGFAHVELAATLAGEPLYRACGYAPIEAKKVATSKGVEVPIVRMGKTL